MNKPTTKQREYRTPPQLRLNQERAAKVYPHMLRSQGKCIGNGVEMVHGFGRGR